MAHKTFIAYKYSEARGLRDDILEVLGDDAQFYMGETSDSPDLTDTTTENIKRNLRDMIYSTSVTIVIVSPNMQRSKWIDWEIEYYLKEIARHDRVSRANGIVGVVAKSGGDYDWLVSRHKGNDGCTYRVFEEGKLYDIINANRFNCSDPSYTCSTCHTVDRLSGSYISLINQDTFLAEPDKYIENAAEKSRRIGEFEISKSRF